jgi:hypothetical protein
MMKHLDERIRTVNTQAKAQGVEAPFTSDGLLELAPMDVERFLDRFEKAGPDKGAMGPITRQVREFEQQGPKLER